MDRNTLIDNSRRIMNLLRERDYKPIISRGPNGTWLINFEYKDKLSNNIKTWNITNDSLIAEQWWLE